MFKVCWQCGTYHADKVIDPIGPVAICPACGYPHPFQQRPLLVIGGASGTGKSTVCTQLLGQVTGAVLLDADTLWRPEFDSPATGYRDFFETWLRLSKNIGQSGRPVVLFGAGLGVPANLEACVERRYLGPIHYLALVCSDEVLVARLRARPLWRASHEAAFIEGQLGFNQWFKDYAGAPPITLLDTTHAAPDETARQVAAWIERMLRT